jgi:hypothetical protein
LSPPEALVTIKVSTPRSRMILIGSVVFVSSKYSDRRIPLVDVETAHHDTAHGVVEVSKYHLAFMSRDGRLREMGNVLS